MNHCIVPKWNIVRQERQDEVEGDEERNRSPHVQPHQNLITYVVPMCNNNYEIEELRWENGQLGLHGLNGGNNNIHPPKQTIWVDDAGDTSTLESLVHQATTLNFPPQISSCGGKRVGLVDDREKLKAMSKRVTRDELDERATEGSACASVTLCRERERDTTMMTWASFESSPRSLKSARITTDDDSTYRDCSETKDGQGMTKGESVRSQSSARRRSRAAAVHNQSERRRRDRINEKMRALQKLVPNASKTDKASMLDEVIEYLKLLQAQVNMMSNARNMSQMAMPLGMQQQLQMSSLLARMGMGAGIGIGMGMVDANNLARNSFHPLMHASPSPAAATSYVSPPFVPMPPAPFRPNLDASNMRTLIPNFNDVYNAFFAQQSMNMELMSKMATLYGRQQLHSSSSSPSNAAHHQGQ